MQTTALAESQREQLRTILTLCRANGGTTRLERSPNSLIRRGLVVYERTAGKHLRYALTSEGRQVAEEVERAHQERKAAKRAQQAAAATPSLREQTDRLIEWVREAIKHAPHRHGQGVLDGFAAAVEEAALWGDLTQAQLIGLAERADLSIRVWTQK